MSPGANTDIENLHNITSADAVVVASCEMIADGGTNVQGFAESDAVTVDGVDLAVTKMGLDGFFASGYKRAKRIVTLKVLASSPFMEVIRQCIATQDSIPRSLRWNMDITYPALNMTYHCATGVLVNAKEVPDAKETLDDMTLRFEFRKITAQSL